MRQKLPKYATCRRKICAELTLSDSDLCSWISQTWKGWNKVMRWPFMFRFRKIIFSRTHLPFLNVKWLATTKKPYVESLSDTSAAVVTWYPFGKNNTTNLFIWLHPFLSKVLFKERFDFRYYQIHMCASALQNVLPPEQR